MSRIWKSSRIRATRSYYNIYIHNSKGLFYIKAIQECQITVLKIKKCKLKVFLLELKIPDRDYFTIHIIIKLFFAGDERAEIAMKKALVDVNRKIALKLRKRNNTQHEQVSHAYSESDVTTARTSVKVE